MFERLLKTNQNRKSVVRSIDSSPDFLAQYVDDGYTEFKFEVGAHEAGGNRIFTEGEFEIEEEE